MRKKSVYACLLMGLLVFSCFLHPTMKAEELSEEEQIIQVFEENGYEVSDDAEVYAVEVDEINGNGTAIEYVMQEETDGEIELTYICDILDPETIEPQSTGTSSVGHQFNYTGSTLVSIGGTASFKVYTDTSKSPTKLIQPQSVSFSYMKKKATASVTYAAARYVCQGKLRNTSTWASVNNDYRYTILCGRNNPTPSNYYSSSTPISSTRGIDITGDPGGQLLTFELTINGSSYSYPSAYFYYN